MNSLLLLYWQCSLILHKTCHFCFQKDNKKQHNFHSFKLKSLSMTFIVPLCLFKSALQPGNANALYLSKLLLLHWTRVWWWRVWYYFLEHNITRRVPLPQSDDLEEDSVKKFFLWLRNELHAVKNGCNSSTHTTHIMVYSPLLELSFFPPFLIWSVSFNVKTCQRHTTGP